VRDRVDVKLLIFTVFESPSYLGFDRGNGAKSIDGEGNFRANHGDGHLFGSKYTKLDEFGDLEFAEYGCGDNCRRRIANSGGRWYEHDSGGFGNGGGVGDTHCNFRNVGIDCGDRFQSFDCERDDCAVYCDGNFLGQFDAKPDELGDLDVTDHERGDDHCGWISDGVGTRDNQDSSYFGKCKRVGNFDGNCSDAGFDCRYGAEFVDCQGDFRAVHRHRHICG
jgi:hypothetical protein